MSDRADVAVDGNGAETRFVDCSGTVAPALQLWPAHLVPKEAIDQEVARLAALPAPTNGRRQSRIVHPHATEPGLGLAPGIRVTLDVLLPGESTDALRHNAAEVNFCIQGRGRANVVGTTVEFERYDVWVTPSMRTYTLYNDGDGVQVRLTYSNAALLEKLNVHFVDEDPDVDVLPPPSASAPVARVEAGIPDTIQIRDAAGALKPDHFLLPYERLVNPDVVQQPVLHWPWRTVKAELDRLQDLGEAYRGRRLYLLYNPATGRTLGTTNTFFCTFTVRPPSIADRPHRHASAAINYFFSGRGNSITGGRTIEWKAGDLMLTAPGWAIHRHKSHNEPVYEMTIQDSPLHLAMDSLLWQENLREPLRLLGSHSGFETNRGALSESQASG